MAHEPKRYLITSALPYANGPLHIGHLAGAYLPADIYVRHLRMLGKEVVWVCGSDEHGAAITVKAMKEGVSPKIVIDRYHTLFKETFQRVGISFDMYHRTSEAIHHETSQDIFRTLYHKGEFIEEASEQYFDEEAGQFLADRYIMGTCPKCGNENAYGDQCERCGSTLSPRDLINPRSTLSGATPVLRTTKHWYLPLDKYEGWLRDYIEKGKLGRKKHHDPDDWKTHVIGQCKSWLDGGLQPRAMTRDLDWGIDVPKEIPGSEGKKIYVWMDAPIGYISATKQWALDNGKDWKQYWQNPDTALIHFIGKDNIVFHCIIFPAILKVHGDYNLPVNVPANQFMNLEGDKISTSRNWAVWVHEYLDELPGKEDELRYHMIKNMPEQRDSEFTWKGYQESNNNELVNNLANFVHRVLVLTNKYYDGIVPDPDFDQPLNSSHRENDLSSYDIELLDLHDRLHEIGAAIRSFDFRGGLKALMEVSSAGNQFLQFNAPWSAYKENPEQVELILNTALQMVTALSVACRPFLPFASDRLRKMLNLPVLREDGEWLDMLDQLAEGEPLLPAGHKIQAAEHLFARLPDELIQTQIDKLEAVAKARQAATAASTPEITYAEPKETIQYDDFAKLDIRTATILHAEKVPKADKLLKLSIDLGYEQRTVVSGIAEHFTPEEIIGRQVLLVANLAPRKLRGIESQGMILTAENHEGKLAFVAPPAGYGNGWIVK